MYQRTCQNRKGQAATELAIFGAIIIFLIGGIVRSALSASHQQNQQLKAMRQALLLSYQGRALVDHQPGTTGHNSASIIYIEDRLSPDYGKFGSSDRVPFVAMGSGSLTNMFMYPVDLDDARQDNNLSVLDVFINGRHFTFSTQGIEEGAIPQPDPLKCSGPPNNPGGNGTSVCGGWDFQCKQVGGVWLKCPLFYTMSITPGDYGHLNEDQAYDLNRNDRYPSSPVPDNEDPGATGKPARNLMDWHWKAVRGLCANISIDKANGNYPSYDVFNHKQEGTLYDVGCDGNGIITNAVMLNSQSADIDASWDPGQSQMQYGFQKDTVIYTRNTVGADNGGYLQLKEGKLYNPETGAFVRSVSGKDQVEVIERRFLLNNDTGRMCGAFDNHGTTEYRATMNPVEVCASTWQDCFVGDNLKQTCFGVGNPSPDPLNPKAGMLDPDNPKARMLYIRTRMLDRRGLSWKTDVSGALP